MAKKRTKLTDQIRQAVDASELSRYGICKELGIEQSSMSRFMANAGGLSIDNLDRLAGLLELDIVQRKGRPKGKGE